MIRSKSLRPSGSVALATLLLLACYALMPSGIFAQSAPTVAADASGRDVQTPFLTTRSFSVPNAPTSVAVGDLKGDGKLDLVTADSEAGKVTVFLGLGKGEFAPGVSYNAGSHPGSVTLADIDGDGRLDVIVCNELEGTIRVLAGSGDGKLQPARSYSAGLNPALLVTGDFGGKGRTDVAVASVSGQRLAVLLNDGNGNLKAPVFSGLHGVPSALTTGDFRHDGHADIALANHDGTVSILLGVGDGTFRSGVDVRVGSGPLSSITAADLKRDGKIDLVVTEAANKLVSVLAGSGDGRFTRSASYAVGINPVFSVISDVDGDGIADLIVVNQGSNTFSVLKGIGDGTFRSAQNYVVGKGPLAAVAGDFDGDGRVDLAVINHLSHSISVPLGLGDGTFKASRSYTSELGPHSIASGNLNGDKMPGLVVANSCGTDPTCRAGGSVSVFLADEAGIYRLASTYPLGAGPHAVALLDVDGDKNLDIVALNRADRTISVLRGVGDGSFLQPMTFPVGDSPVAVAVGDFSHSGKPELAVLGDCGAEKCSQPGTLSILMGTGDGGFRGVGTYPVDYSPTSIAVGDLNSDKNLDIVVGNACGKDAFCKGPGTANVFIGDAHGGFKQVKDINLGISPSAIALVGLSGHGRLDLVVTRSSDNTLALLRGNGDGSFQAPTLYKVGAEPRSIAVADFNGDVLPDVAVSNFLDATVSVLLAKGDGSLLPAYSLPVGAGPEAVVAVGGINGVHAGLATANGNSGSSTPGAEITVLENIQPQVLIAPSIALTSSPNPSDVNGAVTLTAVVTGTTAGAPTQSVTFDATPNAIADCNGTTSATVTTNTVSGDATTWVCVTNSLQASSQSVTAVYSGDTTYSTITSTAVVQNVNQIATSLALTTSSATTSVNQPVTFNATLTATPTTPIALSGKVSFTFNGNPITDCPDVTVTAPGIVPCTTSSLPANSYQVAASYTGDTNFKSSTATAVTQTVNQVVTSLGLTTSSATTSVNEAVTFKATLSATPTTPIGLTGKVSFTFNGNPIADCPDTAVTAPGAVSCTTSSLAANTYQVAASYTGDTNFSGSTATAVAQTVNQVVTTVGLTTSSATTSVNQSVTFKATLSATPTTPIGLTGKVSFTFNGNPIADCADTAVTAPGVVTCTTSSLLANTYQVVATYSGDTNFQTSSATALTQTVNPIVTSLGLATSSATTNVNQSVTFTATLKATPTTPISLSGAVSFTFNGNPITDCPATTVTAPGPVTCTTSSLTANTYQVAASYSGDTNFKGSTATALTQTVKQLVTSLGLASSSPTSNVDQSVTFTATLNATPTTPTPISGTVSFTFNGIAITDCPAVTVTGSGPYVCTTSSLIAKSYKVGATYSGDTNFKGSTATQLTQVVNALATTLKLTASTSTPTVDASVTFTAALTAAAITPIAPSGTVSFTINGATRLDCPAITVNGTNALTCTTQFVSVQPYVVVATYSGDNNFKLSTATSNPTVKPGTTVDVLTNPSSASVNQSVAISVSVAPPPLASGSNETAVSPTGSVTFNASGITTSLCTVQLTVNAGAPSTAVCNYAFNTAILSPGTTITAKYTGDTNFAAANITSNTKLIVGAAGTQVNLSSTPNPSTVNQSVNFTATIAFPSGTFPTGNVQFKDALTSKTLCTQAVNAADGTVPVCTVPLFVAGTHSVTAVYSGDKNFKSGTSGAVSQQVNGTATATTIISSNPPTSTVNQAVTFSATVVPAIAPFPGSTIPQGSVAFADGVTGTTVCTATLRADGTVPGCTAAFYTATTHTITATYTSSNANFLTSISSGFKQVVSATATTTTIKSSTNPSSVNQSVTFSATVTPGIAGVTIPQGTVTYADGLTNTTLCTVTLTAKGAVPTCTTSFTVANTHPITATYTSSDLNFSGSASLPLQQAVGVASSAVSIASGLNPSTVNESVTFTATLAFPSGSFPSGSVTFNDSLTSMTLCTVTVNAANGSVPVCAVPLFIAGTHPITAAYSGDKNFKSGTSNPVNQVVKATATSIAVASNLNPSTVNQTVNLSAIVTPAIAPFNGSTIPQGTVTYTDGLTGKVLCSALPLSSAGVVPACPTAFLVAATHPITAKYANTDGNFLNSTSVVLSQKVNATATATTITSAMPSPSTVNEPVTFNATVVPAVGGFTGAAVPQGKVTFTDGVSGSIICTATLNTDGTVPGCKVALFTATTHAITAAYTSSNLNFQNSISSVFKQGVNATATATAIKSSTNPSSVNQSVTFSATVTPGIAGVTIPQGTVKFTDGLTNTTLCTVTLTVTGAVPTCTTSFTVANTHPITATYTSSDLNFSGSASLPLQQAVGVASSAVSIASGLNPSTVNESVTFTATLAFPSGSFPSGTVTFNDSLTSMTLCKVTVNATNGTVPVCTVPLFIAGTHPVTAGYSGDTNFKSGTSKPVNQVVTATATTIALASNLNPSTVNQTVNLSAIVTPAIAPFNGSTIPQGTVTFTDGLTGKVLCSALPLSSAGVVPTCPTAFLVAGTHPITAKYASTDGNFLGSTSVALAQTVNATATATTITSAIPSPSTVNEPVTFNATVVPAVGGFTGAAVPQGKVTFTDGVSGSVICTATLNTDGTVPGCKVALFTATTHAITAAFIPSDGNFLTSTSAAFKQTVNPTATTTTVTSATPSSSTVNQGVTFSATVVPAVSGTTIPQGTVTYTDQLTGKALCANLKLTTAGAVPNCAVSAGFSTAATHPIIATYTNTDGNFVGGTSAALGEVVSQDSTTVTVTSSMPVITATQSVTFTATVTPGLPVAGNSPTKTVAFLSSDGTVSSANCGAQPLTSNGDGTAFATCTVTFLPTTISTFNPTGAVTVSVTYSGDSNFLTSNNTKSPLTQIVKDFEISFSITPTGPVTLIRGYTNVSQPFQSTNITTQSTPAPSGTNGFADNLQLTCVVYDTSGTKPTPVTDPSCTLPSPATLPGNGNGKLTVNLTASSNAALGVPYAVVITATDKTTQGLLHQTSALPISIVDVSAGLTLGAGAVATESVIFNTEGAGAKAPLTLDTFTCITKDVYGNPVSAGAVICTGVSTPASSGPTTSVPIKFLVSSSTATAVNQPLGASSITLAGFVGVPLLALMGWIGSRKSARRNFFRFLSLLLLVVGLSSVLGCGAKYTPPVPPKGLAAGKYTIEVTATSSTKPPSKGGPTYYAVVPLTVD